MVEMQIDKDMAVHLNWQTKKEEEYSDMSPMVALDGLQRSTAQVVECWPFKMKSH